MMVLHFARVGIKAGKENTGSYNNPNLNSIDH